MIHMGDEIGQREAWNTRIGDREGAVQWHLLDSHPSSHFHRGLQECVADLNGLYRSLPTFWNPHYKYMSHYAPNGVLGFHRTDSHGQNLAVICNFSIDGFPAYDFPLDPEAANLTEAREIFNTDGVQYGGTGEYPNRYPYIVRNEASTPTHLRIALPPLSLLVFEEKRAT